MGDKIVLQTNLPLQLFIRGKVRDTYDLGKHLLIIATDRISAFDVVLPCGIPQKGQVLNQLSTFWFQKTASLVSNHLVKSLVNARQLHDYLPGKDPFSYPDFLAGRSMVVKKVKRIPVECVVRGYIAGSAWSEYQSSGTACGLPLPKGLLESQELPEPIFTPTTKADTGHDEPLTLEEMEKLTGKEIATEIRDKSLAVYNFAREYARKRGIIIADTKMEFGLDEDNRIILIDELLTPDSSRFWDIKLYRVGQSQPSYDKQPVRDWLTGSGWNKTPPAPMLPPDVIEATSQRYIHAYEALTGKKLK